ncbi:MAG: DUF6273 domain-containing protein [Oscillospiraceae bacterium]|nr:DUF6273 domain-containing protein [Oscillospiraceae bacterium]
MKIAKKQVSRISLLLLATLLFMALVAPLQASAFTIGVAGNPLYFSDNHKFSSLPIKLTSPSSGKTMTIKSVKLGVDSYGNTFLEIMGEGLGMEVDLGFNAAISADGGMHDFRVASFDANAAKGTKYIIEFYGRLTNPKSVCLYYAANKNVFAEITLATGEPIGNVVYTDITAYINGNPIPIYNINGYAHIVVEDLKYYGFDVKWNGDAKILDVERNKNKAIQPLPAEPIPAGKKIGDVKAKYVSSPTKVFLSGDLVNCYSINGYMYMDFELLKKYGDVKWDAKSRKLTCELVGGIIGGEISVGRNVIFGRYEWRVLDIQNGKALLLSDKVIEKRAYNTESKDITWEKCTLRKYLNNEFYNSFDAAEKALIVETTLKTNDNPWYGTSGGNTTKDKIFLLSLEEVVKYFGDSGQLNNYPTNEGWIDDIYNVARIAKDKNGVVSWWWSRSPGGNGYLNAGVLSGSNINLYVVAGILNVFGGAVDNSEGGVRPAMWVNLK